MHTKCLSENLRTELENHQIRWEDNTKTNHKKCMCACVYMYIYIHTHTHIHIGMNTIRWV